MINRRRNEQTSTLFTTCYSETMIISPTPCSCLTIIVSWLIISWRHHFTELIGGRDWFTSAALQVLSYNARQHHTEQKPRILQVLIPTFLKLLHTVRPSLNFHSAVEVNHFMQISTILTSKISDAIWISYRTCYLYYTCGDWGSDHSKKPASLAAWLSGNTGSVR
jgi:hypothetical protein